MADTWTKAFGDPQYSYPDYAFNAEALPASTTKTSSGLIMGNTQAGIQLEGWVTTGVEQVADKKLEIELYTSDSLTDDSASSVAATATTGTASTNNALTYTAVTVGTAGNGTTVTLTDPSAASQALLVTVVGTDIDVSLATDSDSELTSTAALIILAIAAKVEANALIVAINTGTSDGSGIVGDETAVTLIGGIDGVAAAGALTISGVAIDGETVTCGADVYEMAADAAQTVSGGNIAVDIESDTTKSAGILTVDTQVDAEDTITLGATTYTFKAGATAVVDQIGIGSNVGDCQLAIVAAINGTDGFNSANASASAGTFAADDSAITALIGGVAGDTIVSTSSFTTGTNQFDGVTLGTTPGVDCIASAAVTALVTASASGTELVTFADGTGDVVDIDADNTGTAANSIATTTDMANGAFADVTLVGGIDEVYATIGSGTENVDNAVTYTANEKGTIGNDIKVALLDPSAIDQSLTIDVNGNEILISLATDGAGDITTTGDLLKAGIAADDDASDLITGTDTGTSDGSGVVIAVAEFDLTGGTDAEDAYVFAETLYEASGETTLVAGDSLFKHIPALDERMFYKVKITTDSDLSAGAISVNLTGISH